MFKVCYKSTEAIQQLLRINSNYFFSVLLAYYQKLLSLESQSYHILRIFEPKSMPALLINGFVYTFELVVMLHFSLKLFIKTSKSLFYDQNCSIILSWPHIPQSGRLFNICAETINAPKCMYISGLNSLQSFS